MYKKDSKRKLPDEKNEEKNLSFVEKIVKCLNVNASEE